MKAGKLFILSRLKNGCRISRIGIAYDDYGDESGNKCYEERRPLVRLPNDKRNPEALNGPVIIVQKGRKKDGK
jgi:hypothetical protein